jgi:hypothetical protein
MAADIYRKLQQQLDHYSMGFPETASGIEIKILQYLFTEQEAQMFSLLTSMLETAWGDRFPWQRREKSWQFPSK